MITKVTYVLKSTTISIHFHSILHTVNNLQIQPIESLSSNNRVSVTDRMFTYLFYGGTQRPTFSQFSPHHTFFQNTILKKSVVWCHTTTSFINTLKKKVWCDNHTTLLFPKRFFEKKCGVESHHNFFHLWCPVNHLRDKNATSIFYVYFHFRFSIIHVHCSVG